MIYFPTAKINLGLRILGPREDGFHNIESVFLPTKWCDVLEVCVLDEGEMGSIYFTSTGIEIEVDSSENLVVRAHRLISEKLELPPVRVNLLKVIPTGAGLGGGSADGAFMLKALNEVCELGLSNDKLRQLAAKLGSDCPFFIDNVPTLVTGVGDKLERIKPDFIGHDLSTINVLIINPGVHVNTAKAFTWLDNFSNEGFHYADLEKTPIGEWEGVISNDFTIPVSAKYPEISLALEMLKEAGADYIQMTGSGSSVFGLFCTENAIKGTKNALKVQKTQEKASKLEFTTYFGALA